MYKNYRAYIRAVLRDYPRLAKAGRLTSVEKRQRDAVAKTIEETRPNPDGPAKIRLVTLVYFEGYHTIDGAAQECYISKRTAERWQAQFVKSVAVKLGLEDKT